MARTSRPYHLALYSNILRNSDQDTSAIPITEARGYYGRYDKNLACPAAPITLPAVQRIITAAATLRTFHLFFHNWLSPLVTYDVSYGP